MPPSPSGIIDPTKPAKYPVILSDAILGQTANEVFTGIRYNHMPQLSSPSAPKQARLKSSTPGNTSSYDLSFIDNGGKYTFEGTRTIDGKQYVLYFDPSRKAFILDKIDSVFNLNLTRTPQTDNPETLRQQFAHLDTSATAEKAEPKTAPKRELAKPKPKETRRKQPEKKQETKPAQLPLPLPRPLPLPTPPKPEPKRRPQKKMEEEEEDASDDDDGGLLVEYPGSEPHREADFSPAFPISQFPMRRFSDFIRESDADDADGSDEEEDEVRLVDFNLPSPVNNQATAPEAEAAVEEESDADGEVDLEAELEDDLAAELENELRQANSGQDADAGSESEVSEED